MEKEQVFGQGAYTFVYGKKGQYNLELWPLSVGDQLKVSALVTGFLNTLASMVMAEERPSEAAVVSSAVNLVAQNITKVVAIAADLPEDDDRIKGLLDNMTNMQMAQLVEYVWETNYGSVRKNFAGLMEELRSLLGKLKK
jgi:hypothetical protein